MEFIRRQIVIKVKGWLNIRILCFGGHFLCIIKLTKGFLTTAKNSQLFHKSDNSTIQNYFNTTLIINIGRSTFYTFFNSITMTGNIHLQALSNNCGLCIEWWRERLREISDFPKQIYDLTFTHLGLTLCCRYDDFFKVGH